MNFETTIILTIIALQSWLFWQTWRKIRQYKAFFPSSSAQFFIQKGQVFTDSPLISDDFDYALDSLNRYLDKSRGAVPEYKLMKSLVNDPLDSLEEEIAVAIPIPLYLGLIGTMLGVIIGVWNMDALETKTLESSGISILLGGVKVAMLASLFGLLFTTIHSGFLFKSAKIAVERSKNIFFGYLQTELVPTLTDGLLDTLRQFQGNFQQFNQEFSKNIKSLNHVLLTSSRAVETHGQILENIKIEDFSKIASFNSDTMSELRKSVGHLAQFNQFLSQLGEFNQSNQELIGEVRAVLQQTAVVETIAQKVASNLDNHQNLMNLLTGGFQTIEDYKLGIQEAVGGVDKVLHNSLAVFQQNTAEQMDGFKGFIVTSEMELSRAVGENRGILQKLNHLEKLTSETSLQTRDINQMREALAIANDHAAVQTAYLMKIAGRKSSLGYIASFFTIIKNALWRSHKS